MYIKLEIGDNLIACYGVQRQEKLSDTEKVYHYLACRYKQTGPFGEFEKTNEEMRVIEHKYSDGAEVLAAKVLKAYV